MTEITEERHKSGYTINPIYVDKVGASMDCIIRFLDDLYERKTLEAVSLLESVPIDDLWADTNEDINVRRVEKWNACKARMGEAYERNKNLVQMSFPVQPID